MPPVRGDDDGTCYGVRGSSRFSYCVGVVGESNYGTGVHGISFEADGVVGSSITGYGVYGTSSNNLGVYGRSDNAAGVVGESGKSYGVYGTSSNNLGVYGRSDNAAGVVGESNTSYGVSGGSLSSYGVAGFSESGTGLYGFSESGLAGLLDGNVRITGGVDISGPVTMTSDVNMSGPVTITGPLTKPGGSFKIDHPLDPANKYLSHSFVESPDMKNVYDGVVRLDDNGEAEIELPDWFSALNKDFRYQLTAIGAPAPNLYISEEISDGVTTTNYYSNGSNSNKNNNSSRFKIAGGASGMKVSWQVTGIRKDPWANAHRIRVEEDKPATERGYYTYPELFGQPEEKGISRFAFSSRKRKERAATHK
jgi:hypothetical protein